MIVLAPGWVAWAGQGSESWGLPAGNLSSKTPEQHGQDGRECQDDQGSQDAQNAQDDQEQDWDNEDGHD